MSFLDVITAIGRFEIALLDDRAPGTCAYFRQLAEQGAFADGSIFRVVSRERHASLEATPIDVVQVGTHLGFSELRRSVPHEHTGLTGLRHRQGTVSAARFAPGELYGSFFVCLHDEPALDFGGKRHEDNAGFAAFGEVTRGWDVILGAHRRAEDSTSLAQRIPVANIAFRSRPVPVRT